MDYSRIYNELISHRRNNPLVKSQDLYTEVHHIIPRCMGGNDSEENLVRLTAGEHFIAHKLLARVYPENFGVQMAVNSFFMRRHSKGTVITTREFELLRIKSSQQSSIRMKRFHSDPKSKEFMRMRLYENKEVLSRQSTAAKEQWKSPEHQQLISKTNSERGIEVWKDPAYAARHFEGRQRFFETNKMPWQRPRGNPTKKYWGLAQFCWGLSKYNAEQTNPTGAKLFSKNYDCGERVNIYQRMMKMFSEGWIPNQDPIWLEEFGDYNW